MVFFASFLGATLFAGVASALPRPDSAVGSEVAVSAPNGIILSDTAALASQTAAAAGYPASAASSSYASVVTSYAGYNNGYGSSGYSSSYDNSYSSSSVDSYSSSVDSYSSSSSYNNGYGYSSSYVATSTYSAYVSSQTYGSGYNNWGGSGYDSCVAQCVASYGTPPSSYTPPPYSGSMSSSRNHTVIVAPMQGVLRFVPPFVNASVGDNVHFVWMANNHTVTKSSALLPCNKTLDQPFASGTHNAGFTFDQIVNDTNPTFFYCGTPGHCPKGMWGAINPPMSLTPDASVDGMMGSMVSNDSSLSAMWAYMNSTSQQYNASSMAMSWGSGYNVSAIPSWAQSGMMDNIMYTRTFLAMNPDVMTAEGHIDLSQSQAPIQFPVDVNAAINNAAAGTPDSSSSSSSSTGASSSASATSSSSAPSATSTNGARANVVSGALAGAVFVAVSFLAL